jgi:hypothetical protein
MVHRGRAVVVKKDKYKDVWVNSDGDEVSPPGSPEGAKDNRTFSCLQRSEPECLP